MALLLRAGDTIGKGVLFTASFGSPVGRAFFDSPLSPVPSPPGALPPLSSVPAPPSATPPALTDFDQGSPFRWTWTQSVTGTPFDDIITGSVLDDTIVGRAGDDQLSGRFGNDLLHGDLTVLSGNDLLAGGAGNDLLIGDGGADTLLGGSGFDVLRGEAGDDMLNGGAGIDVLIAGPGTDLLAGGPDADLFRFDPLPSAGLNVIADFESGTDQIALPAGARDRMDLLTFADGVLGAGDPGVTVTPEGLLFALPPEASQLPGSVYVYGVQSLPASDFVWV